MHLSKRVRINTVKWALYAFTAVSTAFIAIAALALSFTPRTDKTRHYE